jgi:hypothetical protein
MRGSGVVARSEPSERRQHHLTVLISRLLLVHAYRGTCVASIGPNRCVRVGFC